MRVSGLQTSDLPARSADRARKPLFFGVVATCAALALLAAGLLALRLDDVTAVGPGGVRWAGIALNALFGLSIVLIALLLMQWFQRHRYEAKLEGTIRRQSRLLQEISAMSTMVELLQTCHTQTEANTVIRGALPKLLPGVGGALYVSRNDDAAALELQVGWGSVARVANFSAEDCWALRRGRPHLYEPASPAAVCRHVGECEDSCLCVPLVSQGETLAVLHLRAAVPERISEDVQRLASALAEQLSLAVGNLRLQETLRSSSERDPLTDLYNRRHLEISLQRELARAQRHGFPVSLVMLDVDHFKAFNDTNGHDAGDEVLRNVAHVLKRHTRVEDVACRYGGEEFLIVLTACSVDDAYAKAEAIREAIAQQQVFSRGTALPCITASLGIASYPEDGDRIERLIAEADAALYRAKATGRNRIVASNAPGDIVLFEPRARESA